MLYEHAVCHPTVFDDREVKAASFTADKQPIHVGNPVVAERAPYPTIHLIPQTSDKLLAHGFPSPIGCFLSFDILLRLTQFLVIVRPNGPGARRELLRAFAAAERLWLATHGAFAAAQTLVDSIAEGARHGHGVTAICIAVRAHVEPIRLAV